ncbi:MAG: hypothetical protein NZ942_01270 [Candidatus Aenigmarchaeota archaeon]|nr:hypothetical protein [Candidatus Aenigmarchaeota archaeon]
MLRKKAQVFTFDVFFSLIFFVSVFVIWLLITNQLVEQASYAYELNMLDKKLQRASDMLIRSKGIPEDWESNPNEAKAFGLVKDSEYILSKEKILQFLNMLNTNPDKTKNSLGFSGYNLYVRFANITGDDFDPPYEGGNFPSEQKIVVSINRYFLMDMEGSENKELAMMQMIVWR